MQSKTNLGTLDELLSGGFRVLLDPTPGAEGRGLQGAAVGEGERPGLDQGAVVNGVQVDGCLFFALSSGQEGHACVTECNRLVD